ncbi:N-acetyltransferase [Candidatus Marinarcus aquaticus]|uniref:GNAT family N-acetyltransferase n=1 Tax=Candidatus Marinarcus aquaticus TaxID=2044504 RepID=A0A4Q0XW12_9BACT|nr:N-acetyltransferase [Candidatus Marinarcus aquaticus]RXJ60081.1 GNAT family N-acetyltransferase [Candidatus Marinarcus aquaticus]
MDIKTYKPNLTDIVAMQQLVKTEVEKGIILLRTSDEMATTIRSYTAIEVDGVLAGFCALHIHSVNLAEIRSLVVSDKFRGLGLGKRLVKECLDEGKHLHVKEVLSLTYQKDFFEKLGFNVISKESIPEHKIWADCIRCKHFPVCDEVALLYKLEN